MRDLACLDETVRLGTRLGDGSALLLGLGTIIVRCGVDRQCDEIAIFVGRGLVARTSHDRMLTAPGQRSPRMAQRQARGFATCFRWSTGGALIRDLGVPAIAAAIARKSLFEQVSSGAYSVNYSVRLAPSFGELAQGCGHSSLSLWHEDRMTKLDDREETALTVRENRLHAAPAPRSAHGRSTLAVAAGAALVLLSLAACSPDENAAEDLEEEPTGKASSALVAYDCTKHTDTGYRNGTAFPITVVTVDGNPVESATADAFLTMAKAAEADGVVLRINSGFRTMAEQQYLYHCYVTHSCNSGNLAAQPGYSNHQSGHAIDINTGGGALTWLNAHGASHGFARTVPSETWHWEWWGGGSVQAFCQATPPIGYLDAASCSSISGWTQDPAKATAAISVDVFFDGVQGAPGAQSLAVVADVPRADLCAAVGSCNHGFSMPPPRGLMDGKAHAVHAYGVSGAQSGALNGEGSFTCAPPKAPFVAAVKRHVVSPASFTSWRFSALVDVAHYPDAQLVAFADGDDIAQAPELVQADDGTAEVWLIDGKTRRHIIDPASFAAWRFDSATIKKTPAATVYANALGQDWPSAPFLVQGGGPAIYVLDGVVAPESTPAGPPGGSPGEPSGATPSVPAEPLPTANDAAAGESGGCTASRLGARGGSAWVLLAGVLILGRRWKRSTPKPRVRHHGS